MNKCKNVPGEVGFKTKHSKFFCRSFRPCIGCTLCTFNIVAPLIYHLLPNVWNASYTISAFIFVDVPYWLPYSKDNFISCVVPGPSQWFFHFGEEIVITWTHIGWVRWMFQNLPLPAMQEVRDSSGVTPCIVMKNNGILEHPPYSPDISPCDYDLFAKVKEPLRGTRYNTGNELIPVIGLSIRIIKEDGSADGVRRLPNICKRW